MRFRNILLVHPARTVREMMRSYCYGELDDVRVKEAESAQQAKTLLSEQAFHLVISALELDSMDASGILGVLRQTALNSQTPLLVVSASSDTQKLVRLQEKGIHHIQTIPVSPWDFAHKVNQLCDPRGWRGLRRIQVEGATARLHSPQGDFSTHQSNASLGGVALESTLEGPHPDYFQVHSVTLRFPTGTGEDVIGPLKVRLLQVQLFYGKSDAPEITRTSWAFTSLAQGDKVRLERVFQDISAQWG
ncbi:MAG: response regulator [Deltaproteobacteria bacterium]|nr:response regulator [Deltaproteobacteria bacterium]